MKRDLSKVISGLDKLLEDEEFILELKEIDFEEEAIYIYDCLKELEGYRKNKRLNTKKGVKSNGKKRKARKISKTKSST